MPGANGSRPRVLVAGGGVAALEALLALHHLVGRRVELELLAPGTHFLNRPASVAEPFGLGGATPVPFEQVTGHCGATLRSGTLAEVRSAERIAVAGEGDALEYDRLVVAVGARAGGALPGAVPFGGPQDVPALSDVLERAGRGELRSIAFTAAAGARWNLPLYELAMMAAVDLRDRGAGDVRLTVVTPEEAPLWLFGEPAQAAVAGLLRERGIELLHGRPTGFAGGRLALAGGGAVAADAAVAQPALQGPWIEGLPADAHGFIPVDRHGRVSGTPDVLAAGDATTFPIKQGGLACQQADAVAATVAAELGAIASAAPFRPVLRGLLLTGGAPLYLRAELDASGAVVRRRHSSPALRGEVSTRALWWPPGKVAGRHLAPYLATARPVGRQREPLADRAVTAAVASSPEAEDAIALALMLAAHDADDGDYAQALHALDAAAALAGGVLPAEAAAQRDEWRAAADRAAPAGPEGSSRASASTAAPCPPTGDREPFERSSR